jgi:hypothetical protein
MNPAAADVRTQSEQFDHVTPQRRPRMPFRQVPRVAVAAFALALLAGPAAAASHSDAPLIKQDPQANLTDVYAFVGTKYNDPTTQVLNVVVQVRPFSEPGDGVIYERFADDALYSIHITDPGTGTVKMRYDFQFSPVGINGTYKNLNTILSYGRGTAIGAIQTVNDAQQNYLQTYSVTRTANGKTAVVFQNNNVPPPNSGKRITPGYNDANGKAVSGATTLAALDTYTKQTLYSVAGGESAWAGPREDGFFADAPGIFDLLDPRILGPDGHGQTGNGVDGFKGYNVLVYALQIPLSQLPSISYTMPALLGGTQKGVGVYASVSRPRTTLRSSTGAPQSGGPFVQVNRMGNPLFNEVLVNLKDKDNYNRASPTDDPTTFKIYAQQPEIIFLLNTVFSLNFQTNNRADLVAIYIPDVLRVNTATGPVPLAGTAGFSRLSLLGGDTVKDTSGNTVPGGWPNGRRLGDDVADIALTAIASGPTFQSIFLLGDNINANDQVFNGVFPYAATPNAGTRNSKDSGPNVGQ